MGRRKKIPPPAFATIRPTWDKNHYVMFFDELLNSPAYIALSSTAKEAYTILMQEYKGPETGPRVKCPYSTFQKKGMRPNTVSRAITQLEFFGFIEVEHGGLEHQPSIYHFSEDWKKIRNKEDVDNIRKQFREHMDKKKKAADRLKETDPPDGIYIRSNESVSKREEKNGQIDYENDSKRPYLIPSQLTEPIPIQVAESVVENDFQRQEHPEDDGSIEIDLQLLKALVEGVPPNQHETLTEPIATEKKNFHIHLIYSERRELPEPEVKIANRNRYYAPDGKHVRTKKEATDDKGDLLPGYTLIPKGEVYESHRFQPKDKQFKDRAFVEEAKEFFTGVMNPYLSEKTQREYPKVCVNLQADIR